MIELLAVPLILAASLLATMTTIYWICAILGGGLLVISTMTGGDADVGGHVDADFDVDVDAGDVSIEHAGHLDAASAGAMSLSAWLSMRFVVFFMAVFGIVGLGLTYLTESGVSAGLTLGIALVAGVCVGQIVHQFVRAVQRNSGDSTPRPQDYVNKLARVNIAFSAPDKGEVALQVRGTKRYVPAVAKRSEAAFARGDDVVVVSYRGGVAEVVSREDFEQLHG